MTQEEKAKAYDEVIEKLRDFYRDYDTVSCLIDVKEELANLFPELKESEDERIRKVLIGWINLEPSTSFNDNFDGFSKEQILAWLEKQGENKPAEWSEEDEKILKSIINDLSQNVVPDKEDMDWLKSLKDRVIPLPKQEWSEEDEKMLQGIIDEIEANKHSAPDYDLATYDRFLSWLKSLRPKNTWKPSDEQLDALHDAAVYVDKSMFPYRKGFLMKLYKQLKKLMEE